MLPEFNNSQHLFDLNFDRVSHYHLLENHLKKESSIFFKHGQGMSFFFIEFNSKELSQLLECVFFIIKYVVLVYPFHMLVFLLQTIDHNFRMSFEMFSESWVVSTFKNVHDCVDFSVDV